MSEPIISFSSVAKMYKLYNSPRDRLKDIFAFSKKHKNQFYREFWALRDINFEVEKGTTLGIIGPNGAGKSTIIKTLVGNLQPTKGQVKVNGKISPMIEIGTGFHPELTGHQNIFSSGMFLGLTRNEIEEKYDSIVDFSEIHEFIHQPVKTYSLGMYARLGFAIATTIEPDILVIDEVLGVGDMYFMGKAISRMRELCEKGNAVIFVSHDMLAIQRLCKSVMWLEKGRIVELGPAPDVIKSYENKQRIRQNLLVKAKNRKLRSINFKKFSQEQNNRYTLLMRICGQSVPYPDRLAIHRISLLIDNILYSTCMIGDAQDTDQTENISLIAENMNWSGPTTLEGHRVRYYGDFGILNKHAAFCLKLDRHFLESDCKIEIEIEYFDNHSHTFDVELYDDISEAYVFVGTITTASTNRWKTCPLNLEKALRKMVPHDDNGLNRFDKPDRPSDKNDKYGEGPITITDVQTIKSDGEVSAVFVHPESIRFRISFIVEKQVSDPNFILMLNRIDGILVSWISSGYQDISFNTLNRGEGYIDFYFDKCPFGAGEYIISAAIRSSFKSPDVFMDTKIYSRHDRAYRVIVKDRSIIQTGVVAVDPEITIHKR